MKKIVTITLVFVFGMTFLALAEGENVKVESNTDNPNPTEDPKAREAILKAMEQHIKDLEVDGIFLHYDPVTDELLNLTFKKPHTGVATKGKLFAACVDFTDEEGILYDLDFLAVKEKDGSYKVLQAIVHAVDKQVRPYHVHD